MLSTGVEAIRFRAGHEDELSRLDQFEKTGQLLLRDGRYLLPFSTVQELRKFSPAADKAIYLCESVYSALRDLYKKEPQREYQIADFAEVADLPESDVRKAITLLRELPVFQLMSGDVGGNYSRFQISESVLREKTAQKHAEKLRAMWDARNTSPDLREKQQKFKILDAPNLVENDLAQPVGELGRALVYLDVDDFKKINTRLTETIVDREVLPPIHRLLKKSIQGLGYAYAAGGDEFIFLFPNASLGAAIELAEAVRSKIASSGLKVGGEALSLSASFGVAHELIAGGDGALQVKANRAKDHAKRSGKNCVVFERDGALVKATPHK